MHSVFQKAQSKEGSCWAIMLCQDVSLRDSSLQLLWGLVMSEAVSSDPRAQRPRTMPHWQAACSP